MEQNEFRCHYSVVFENLGRVFWLIVICFAGQIDEMASTIHDVIEGRIEAIDALIAFGILFGILLLCFIVQNIVWAKTWISIEQDAVVIEKRTINRKKNTIGMKNISNINLEQNIFERIMNTYKIKLDTNSKTTANETDVKIVLSKEKAEWFRRQVLEHMQAVTNEAVVAEDEDMDFDVTYSAKEIVMHCLYTASVSSVLILIGIIIGAIVGLRSLHTGAVLVDSIVSAIGGILVVAVILCSVIQSMVKDFFVYYNFRAKRQENKIYLTYGLLKKRRYVLSVDKINAVEVVSPLVSRIFGRQYIKLVCIGVGDEQNENSMLLLSETKKDMEEKLSILLPEFTWENVTIHKRDRLSIFSEIPKKIIWFAILIGLMVMFGYMNLLEFSVAWVKYIIYGTGFFLIGMSLLNTFMSFYTEGVGIGENELIVISGCYEKKTIWIPYQKIQQLGYSEGLIRRHFGLATGVVHILAQVLDSVHTITFLKKEVFEQIGERILQRKSTYKTWE